jgi:LPXTG-motif cell wall-anchored protein
VKVKRWGLLSLLGFVLGLTLFVLPASGAQAQEACYPPGSATCPTTSTTAPAVAPTEAAQSGTELARTGSSSTMPLSAVAAVLIAAGGLFVLVTRRRTHTSR